MRRDEENRPVYNRHEVETMVPALQNLLRRAAREGKVIIEDE